MSSRSLGLTQELAAYLQRVAVRDSDVQRRLREETAQHKAAGMQISPEQGAFMALLVQSIGAKRCLEVGVFTGYSSLVVAQALPEDGRLIACDVSEEWTAIARRYWQAAGVGHKIDLRLGPALDTLDRLIAAGERGRFDFAFIDADKKNYDGYYERALALLRVGGLIGIDNVLWGGSVIDAAKADEDTTAIRALNQKLQQDQRVDICMLPIGDGLTLARKRG
ncbi:MAG: SAM-dependent methyltransferase [Alphaproteobacteria bacterium]|nr:SAM-dependent methyltransferase [Alphaproteobacteria bacterium]